MKLTKTLKDLVSLMAFAIPLSACGSSILGSGDTGGGGGGDGGSQSTGTGGGSTGTGNGSTGTGNGSTGAGGGQVCGGFNGQPCPAGSFCDYPDDLCGAADGPGVCRVPLGACDDIYQPVCGCDGKVYANICEAFASESDVSPGGCTAPPGWFQCGSRFCQSDSYYCVRTTSDVVGYPDDYSCRPLPSSCGKPATWPNGVPDCACVAGESCGDQCEVTSDLGLKLTCPGG